MTSYNIPRSGAVELPMGTAMCPDVFEESSADPLNERLSRSRSFDRHIAYAQHMGGGGGGGVQYGTNIQSPPMPSPARFATAMSTGYPTTSNEKHSLSHRPSISFQQNPLQTGGLKEQMSMYSLHNAAQMGGSTGTTGNQSGGAGGASMLSGNTMVVGATQAKETVDKTTEVLQSKLPHFMRNIPENVTDKVPPPYRDMKEFDVEDSSKGVGGNRWTAKDYYDFYARKTLERRLTIKNLIIATIAEFVGTFMFLFFALAINSTCSTVKDYEKTSGYNQTDLIALMVSSVGFAFSLAISAWVFFRVSGGVQNPAITLALTLTGALTWTRAICLTIAQYLGAIAASGLIVGLYPFHQLNSRTTLGPTTTINQGFWLELLMSAQLIFTVLMLAAEKHRGTFLAPVGIGLCLFITQLLGQPYTGASVNPARTLGPDVAQGKFDNYCWIYYAGPYLAAIITSGFYRTLKWLRYETATPDQDADEARAGQTCQVLVDTHGNHVGRLDTFNVEEYQAIMDAQEKAEQDEIIARHKEMQALQQIQAAQLQAQQEAAALQQSQQQQQEGNEKEYLQPSSTNNNINNSAYGGITSTDGNPVGSFEGRRPSMSSPTQNQSTNQFNRSYSVSSPKRAAHVM